jgi:hypothetical protein
VTGITAAPRPLPQDPARLGVEPAPVVSPSATRAEIDDLVEKLRTARGSDRVRTVERLVRLGAFSQQDLEAAIDDARFEADLLAEAETRLAEGGKPVLPDRKRPAAATWIEEKYRVALDRYLARDYLGAMSAVDAIFSLEPSPQARPKLERLRRRARERLVAETVIATSIVPEERLLETGKPLRAHVLLENMSRDELVLRSAPGTPLGQVVVDYEELLPDSTRTMRRATKSVTIDRDLRLGRGDRIELDIPLSNEHAQKKPHVVGRYRLSGRLRPYTLLAGDEALPYFLPLFEVFVFVVDPEDRTEAPSSKEAFALALEAARSARDPADGEAGPRRVFVAALLWASEDRDAALAAIVQGLEPASGQLALALTAALARITGEPVSFSKEEWLAWWKSAQSRPRVAHRAGGPSLNDEVDDDDDPTRSR